MVSSVPVDKQQTGAKMDWLPITVIALAQILVVANVSMLSVSVGSIVADFNTSASSVQMAIVVYSLLTAAFMILGGKLSGKLGARLMFQAAIILLGIGLLGVALSGGPTLLIASEAVAGIGAAALVPTLIALIVANYQGKQQALAIGVLGAASGIGGSIAILTAGILGTVASWRLAFWAAVALAVLILILSFRLRPSPRHPEVVIDWVGVVLSVAAISLISIGVGTIATWGLFLAKPGAPFSLAGLSPSLVFIVVGILLGAAFFAWQKRRVAQNKTPLLSPEVLDTSTERMTSVSLLLALVISSAVMFLLPLYMQIVQGYNSLRTALAIVPFALAVFASAILVTRLVGSVTPRQIGRYAFVLMGAGLLGAGIAIENDWNSIIVVLSLVLTGLGLGAAMTLMSNVLVSASPPDLSGEVGAWRGTVNNLGTAIGTALAGAVLTATLAGVIAASLAGNTILSQELMARVNLDSPAFISNSQLESTLAQANVPPAEVNEAVRINTEARLQALKAAFFGLAMVAFLAIIPASGLPTGVQQPASAPKKKGETKG